MPIAQEDHVRVVLKDFESRICWVMERAWDDWRDIPNSGRFIFRRTRSNIVFDFICQHALTEFDGDPDIHVIARRGTLQFLFRDSVLLRFKKGNSRGVGSNILTQAVLDFIDPQLNIPGLLPDIHRVEVCYQENLLGTDLDDLAVVARDRTQRIWSYPISDPHLDAEIVPLQPRPSDPVPPLVTPKKPKEGVDSSE